MHFVYKMDNLFRSIGVSDETHLLHQHFFFLTYYSSRLFLHSVCTIQSHVINFQPFLTSFHIFHAFTDFWAKWPWKWKALQMNSEKVESCHDIIISPTQHVLKSWDGYGKNWMHFRLFVCSKCTIQSHIINFQPFMTSFAIFHAFAYFLS